MAKFPRRLMVGIAALTVASFGAVVPVGAQDSTTTTQAPTTTAPSTTTPPTTEPPTTEPPTTTGGDSTTTTSQAEGGPTTTILEGEGDGEETTTTLDVLSEEEPSGEVPDTDHTVPAKTDGISSSGRYSGQGEFQVAKVLFSSVNAARSKVQAAKLEHEGAIASVKSLRLRQKELDEQKTELTDEARQTLILLERMETQLRERALNAFVRGSEAELGANSDYDDILDLQVKNTLIESLLKVDHRSIVSYEELRDSLGVDATQVLDRSVLISDLLGDFELDVDDRRADIEQAERELEAFEAGSAIYIEGVVFPIGDFEYEVPMIDSWGYPRALGSEDEHWHEGIDIFAPTGAPLVATERGVISRVGTGSLGGLRLWLHGESGTDWYYAHLSAFASGLHEGQVVEVGEVIGYVGATGNAVGTPPHLHMQVHPGGGDPVNPYPLLFVVSNREIQAEKDLKVELRRQREEVAKRTEELKEMAEASANEPTNAGPPD